MLRVASPCLSCIFLDLNRLLVYVLPSRYLCGLPRGCQPSCVRSSGFSREFRTISAPARHLSSIGGSSKAVARHLSTGLHDFPGQVLIKQHQRSTATLVVFLGVQASSLLRSLKGKIGNTEDFHRCVTSSYLSKASGLRSKYAAQRVSADVEARKTRLSAAPASAD